MKNKLLVCILMLLISNVLFAKKRNTGYCYKELSSVGICCTFSIIKDSVTYLVLETQSHTNVLDAKPKIQIRFFNDDTITLCSENVQTNNNTTVMPSVGGLSAGSINSVISRAKFPLKDGDIEKFALGIKKIRISTIPNVHEREFKKDKIGYKIYKLYLNAKPLADF